MIRRPKPSEDEEDLLRMQEEYIMEKNKDPNKRPAAQVTSLQRTEPPKKKAQTTGTTSTRKPSKYAQSKGLSNKTESRSSMEASTSSVMGDILEKNVKRPLQEDTHAVEDDKVYYPTVKHSILGNIVEKNVNDEVEFHEVLRDFQPMPTRGFPEAIKRDPSIVSGQKSIHKQHLEMKQVRHTYMEIDQPKSKTIHETPANLPGHSYIVSSNEANDIHSENMKLLSTMSKNEILEEQQKLMTSLDPKTVEFIKRIRQGKSSENNSQPNNIIVSKQSEMVIEEMDTSVPQGIEKPQTTKAQPDPEDSSPYSPQYDNYWDNDVLTHPNVNEWLHFDSLEKDKLQWMNGVKDSKIVKPDEPYEARFDFKGYLLPYTVEYTEKTKTLFHHGEEPHRPGYSLTELIEMSRSTVTQQRVMALNTLAGVLEYYNAGTYKDILELPLSKIFFIIRIALDENKVIILEPALKAMRNLLYNRIDEASLDALIGFEDGTKQPWLENDKSEVEELETKESELKDFHLAEIDLISAILRTDILQRLYYILETIRPSFNCVQYALQILTRLARDSEVTRDSIVQCEHLMTTIVKNFLPTTSINFMFDPQIVYMGKPLLAAVRLLRNLSLNSGDSGFNLLDKYKILQPISEYISSGVDGTYGLRIQIEAYCVLINLVSTGPIAIATPLYPVMATTLYKHVQGTDIFATSSILSTTHAAVIVQLINKILINDSGEICKQKDILYPLLKWGAEKWIRQMAQTESYTCAHLRLVCSAIDCWTTIYSIENYSKEIYPITFLNEVLKDLSSSKGFSDIIKNLEQSSNLLSGLENKDLHFTKNLVSLGGAVIDSDQKVLPILNVKSPLPFLTSLFKLLIKINDTIISEVYLQHVTPYLKKLAKKVPALTDNWFTRMEVDFVFNVLKLATHADVNELKKDLFYAIANKLCYVLRVDKSSEIQFLFDKFVFNKDWFSFDRQLHLLNISDADAPNALTLENEAHMSIDEIRHCYDSVIKPKGPPGENLNLLQWREPILPRDWIYMPILALYSKRHYIDKDPLLIGDLAESQANQMMVEKQTIISSSLEWILFNEKCFPDLLNDIEVTDRFCRIMCVFLCDDSLFLDSKINILLNKCTQTLFKKNTAFNFDKELVGLHNFEDFYTEILQQFQAVSYGDPTFAACVLVPLAQRHNVKWRQLIWYEYVGCLRYLDCPQELLCYPLMDYMHPEETDKRVLESYNRALKLSYLKHNSVAHKIAYNHVECFKLRTSLVCSGGDISLN